VGFVGSDEVADMEVEVMHEAGEVLALELLGLEGDLEREVMEGRKA